MNDGRKTMEPLTLDRRKMTRGELLLGMGGSFLVHFVVFASAIIAVWTMPRKPAIPPFCTVNLVSLKDIGSGASEPKGNPKAAADDVKTSDAPKRAVKSTDKGAAAVPVKRLQLDESPRRQEVPIKKLEAKEAPRVAETPHNLASVEKNLDKLITKPKAVPRSSTEIQQEPSSKPAASQPQASSRPGKTAPGADNTAHGSPTGAADAGAKGTTVGSTAGTPEGSAVNSALIGLYGEKVREVIQREWRLINDQGLGGLKAVVEVQIRKNGEIVQIQVVKPSGNPMFDDSVLRAVRKAAPLPAVPEVIVQSSTKLILTFKPGQVS